MLRAKFHCSKSAAFDFGGTEVHLAPVIGDGAANKTWSAATPSGELRMMITNAEAQGKIIPGKDYIIDIREAQEGE